MTTQPISEPIRILLVEDEPDYAQAMFERLSLEPQQVFRIHLSTCLTEALAHLAKEGVDVILLDLVLPESKGLETFERVCEQAPEIPIVVLTAVDNDSLALEAVRRGAQDFLVKGQADQKLIARVIRYAIERHRMQSALRNLSMLDDLTGLYNRRGFLRLAEQHMKLAARTKRTSLVMLVDVDGLKRINDSHGHPEGDRVLMETAEVLRATFRTSDIIARIGGDEFAIIAIEASQSNVEVLVSRLNGKVSERNAQQSPRSALSLSVGVACLDPEHQMPLEELMAKADQALYEQKRRKAVSR